MTWALFTSISNAFTLQHFFGSLLGVGLAVVGMMVVGAFVGLPDPLVLGLFFWLIFTGLIMVGDVVALSILGSVQGS